MDKRRTVDLNQKTSGTSESDVDLPSDKLPVKQNREKRHERGGLPQLPMQKSKNVKEYEASFEKLKGNQIESKLERNLLLNMLVGNKTFDIELPI